ncbi:hypothetical protein ABT127_14515 [Streptomyces sp. NPDC001904]|uniref:hypothetical protein n=1 Tax=Streptomyces sp. NPDC001904 TaxID=3154531 RepID=UPI00332DECCE
MSDGPIRGKAEPSAREATARRLRPLAYLSVILVLVSAVLFAVVPFAEAGNRAYDAAENCPAGVRRGGCRAEIKAILIGREDEPSGRSFHYFLSFLRVADDPEPVPHRVRMLDDRSVYEAARVGDRVTVTYWKGEVRQIRLGPLTQQVWRSPADDGRLPGAFALLLLSLGLGLLWACGSLRFLTGARVRAWLPAAGPLAGAVVGVTGLVLCLAGGALGRQDVWFVARICALAVLPSILLSTALCWGIVARMRRAARRVVPVRPTERRCLLAQVYGDVPYSIPGYHYLVVGDGPPAATPDPTGAYGRTPLPDTLTVREVRALTADDPESWHRNYKDLGVVIDCVDTDGDIRVRIGAGRRTAPLILGALTAAAGRY